MCSTNFNYSYLKGFIKTYFGTLENYASFLGISKTALHDKMKGKTSFRQEEIYKTFLFAKEHGMSVKDIHDLFFCTKSSEIRPKLVNKFNYTN